MPPVRSIHPSRLFPAFAAGSLLLQGCLYTTHRFGTGKLLKPGETEVTFGVGGRVLYDCEEQWTGGTSAEGGTAKDSYRCPEDPGTGDPVLEELSVPKISLDYRLGVRESWGPFQAVELGWHAEAPTNFVTFQFFGTLGLPLGKLPWDAHALTAGWGLGMWADNSLFLEYALSRSTRFGRPYANYRATWLATQLQDIDDPDAGEFRLNSRQRWAHQLAAGVHWRLPSIRVVPDFLSPQVSFSYPYVPLVEAYIPEDQLPGFEWNINVGTGWHF